VDFELECASMIGQVWLGEWSGASAIVLDSDGPQSHPASDNPLPNETSSDYRAPR